MHINAGDIKIANTLLALLSLDHTLHKNDKSCPWKALLSSSVKWETLLQQVHILKCSATNSGIVNSCAVLLATQVACFGKKVIQDSCFPFLSSLKYPIRLDPSRVVIHQIPPHRKKLKKMDLQRRRLKAIEVVVVLSKGKDPLFLVICKIQLGIRQYLWG